MLLTIFSNQKTYSALHSLLKEKIATDKDYYFQITFNIEDKENPVLTGTIFELNDKSLLVFDSYNLKLTKAYAKMIDGQFEVYKITNEEFTKIFEKSNQVVECEYVYKNIERKSTAFDLRGLEPFMLRLKESQITSLTLSLKDYNVIITARGEGRISISPDVDATTMIKVVKSLLGNNIRSIIT